MAPWLADVLANDADGGVRKRAARALGHAKSPESEAALLAAWARETDLPALRAIAEALGKVGSAQVSAVLASKETTDPELVRIVAKARLIVDRTELRAAPRTALDPNRAPSRPLPIRFRTRAGLSPLVASELPSSFAPKISSPSAVDATLTGPLAGCFAARTALDFGLVVPPENVVGDDVVGAVVRALEKARPMLAELEAPPHRFRIAWTSSGHQRKATWKIAQDVRKSAPELVNDPTASAWEVVVRERFSKGKALVDLLIVPTSLIDPRFAYRVKDVPAASHPTLAAAIAHVAGARPDDVVWDPFVGSGTELIERARLGPAKRFIGTDTDPAALDAARANAKAANVDMTIVEGDALSYVPGNVTLILTNPPMGRRVHRGADLRPFFDRFLAHVVTVLAPGGRLVLISPLPSRTSERARELGLVQKGGIDVDMGGFSAQIQLFSRPKAK